MLISGQLPNMLTLSVKFQSSASITSDGWKPILGNHREPYNHDEITYYRNPIHLEETVKAEPISSTTETAPRSSTGVPRHAQTAQTVNIPGNGGLAQKYNNGNLTTNDY